MEYFFDQKEAAQKFLLKSDKKVSIVTNGLIFLTHLFHFLWLSSVRVVAVAVAEGWYSGGLWVARDGSLLLLLLPLVEDGIFRVVKNGAVESSFWVGAVCGHVYVSFAGAVVL